MPVRIPDTSSSPSRRLTVAFLLVTIGAFWVVLAALPYKAFELDRHFVPKELALHITAWGAALLCIIGIRELRLTRVDTLLVAYLGFSVGSALFAPNWWLAQRSLAITSSGILLFWVTRTLASAGYRRLLLVGVATATIAGILTALAQAYGIVGDYASLSRAPGGTFGNRNFMAHLAAIGVPTFMFLTLQGRKGAIWIGTIGLIVASAGLVLSRTRAAWLALAVCGVVCAPLIWQLYRSNVKRKPWHMVLAMLFGISAALLLPNTLNWRSDSPYLDSVKDVVNYKEGSGFGRVKQYKNSLQLVLHDPLLGVGPGNWPVLYPTVAPRTDKSLSQESGMTSNPWPSSDWVAMVSERGIPALIVFIVAWVGLMVGAWRQWKVADGDEKNRARALALIATIVITTLTGAFDAVMLIAIPSFLAWVLLGAFTPEMPIRRTILLSGWRRALFGGAIVVLGSICIIRSAGQVHAMSLYEASNTRSLKEALRFDPGSYRIYIQLAEREARRGHCTDVKRSAGNAHRLFPAAPAPKRLLRRCGIRVQQTE